MSPKVTVSVVRQDGGNVDGVEIVQSMKKFKLPKATLLNGMHDKLAMSSLGPPSLCTHADAA